MRRSAVSRTFYRPLAPNRGKQAWGRRQGDIWGDHRLWRFRHIAPAGLPKPVGEKNPYFGRETMPNIIPSAAEVWKKKAEEWGYPHRKPPPSGVRNSREHFPYFFEKYFPEVECRLVLDSVLNVDTTEPVFLFPTNLSKEEIRNYLRNVYSIDNIEAVETRNIGGLRYKNELGWVKMAPAHKKATVTVDTPVSVQLKVVKETSDAKE